MTVINMQNQLEWWTDDYLTKAFKDEDIVVRYTVALLEQHQLCPIHGLEQWTVYRIYIVFEPTSEDMPRFAASPLVETNVTEEEFEEMMNDVVQKFRLGELEAELEEKWD